jgi:ParB-like nuclease domain
MKHQTKMIRLVDITVPPDRMRQLRPEKVDEFAESIAARGQLQPIIIRPQDSGYVLVVGSHRLEAVRKLGHEAIECRVLDGMDADQALLAEIDENLVRADLTPSEPAAHHAKRKQLYLKLHPETEKGKAGGRPRKTSDKMSKVSTKGYAKAAAKKVGKTSRTVARDVSRGEKIDPQALADLAGTCLDNGTELDALAKLPAAEQRRLAEAAKRREKVSAITAHRACDSAPPKKAMGLRRRQCRTLIASPSSNAGPSTAKRSGSASSWSWHGLSWRSAGNDGQRDLEIRIHNGFLSVG